MKKTLLASAIAAATFSGAAMAQTMTPEDAAKKLSAMPTFYGNVQYVVNYNDNDVTGHSVEHADNGTTFGMTHSHAITSDIEAFMKVELEVAAADEKGAGNGLTDLDEAYIGVRGDTFGQVWIGSDDSIYEAQLGDYGNWVFEYGGLNPYSSYTTGENDMIQYMSPSFGGLTVSAAVQVNGNGEAAGAEKSYPYQLGLSYSMDNWTVSYVMDSNDGTADTSNENSYGLSAEYTIDQLVLDFYYDSRKGLDNWASAAADTADLSLQGEEGRDQFGLMGTYNLGPNTFRLAYEMAEADAGELEINVVTLQALHNVSDQLYVYAEAVRRDRENDFAATVGATGEDEDNQLNVGVAYSF